MNQILFNSENLKKCCGKDGRVIILGFCLGATIFLQRLLEISESNDLSNIVIVELPYPDTISNKLIHKSSQELIKTFNFYASLLKLA